MYRLSLRVSSDQGQEQLTSHLEDCLMRAFTFRPSSDAIALSRTNLVLAIYRRIRLVNPNIPRYIIDAIVSAGKSALEVVERMLQAELPWWHVANVPFQLVCVLLALDTPQSMAAIKDAMKMLENVTKHYNTQVMREALKTAGLLVRLAQKRKEEDIKLLAEGLKYNAPEQAKMPKTETTMTTNGYNSQSGLSDNLTSPSLSWPGDFSPGISDYANFNWDSFLSMDLPNIDFNTVM